MIGAIGTIRALVAHQGGWDEILMVAGPIAIIVGLLAVVRRRLGANSDPASATKRDESEIG
jgi:sugar phosphate permease